MAQLSLIVCEKTGRWAAAWRQALGARSTVRTREVRSIVQIGAELDARPNAAVAIEAGLGTPEALLECIATLAVDRGLLVIVMAPPDWLLQEALLLEAGAAMVVYSPRNLAPAAELVARFAKILPPIDDGRPFAETVYDNLPWPQFASRLIAGGQNAMLERFAKL